ANGGTACATNSEWASGVCSRPGTPTQQNACIGGTCEPKPSDPNGPNEGVCPDGPVDNNCSREPFRGCTSNADCNPAPAANCSGDGSGKQPGETCDDGNTTDGDGCDSNCTASGCGNGVRTGAEQCDGSDAAACNGSTCKADCTCNPFCGDGVKNQASEACDPADHASCGVPDGSGQCDVDCTCSDFCGNGIRDGAETCDGADASACPGQCAGDCTCPKMGSLTF